MSHTSKDADTAIIRRRKKLAESGDAAAQYELGRMHTYGEGVPKDCTIAVIWIRSAAEQGHAAAQLDLGQLYRDGDGVPRSYEAAARWFQAAASQNDQNASYQAKICLGEMHAFGQGVRRDHSEAVKWIKAASVQEEFPADAGQYAQEIGDEFLFRQRTERHCQGR